MFPEPVLNATAILDGGKIVEIVEQTELVSGVLYGFTLEATNLQGGGFELSVKGETTPKGTFSMLVSLSQQEVNKALRAYTLLSKALHLAQGLGLSDRELRHVLANRADFGNVDWGSLPSHVTIDQNPEVSKALFSGFLRVIRYATLKQDCAGGSDGLIEVLRPLERSFPTAYHNLLPWNKFKTYTHSSQSSRSEK